MGSDARNRIRIGVDKACDAVRPTLGVVGMTAMIESLGLDPIECDDGVTILKNLEFSDHYENMGLQKLRKAAVRTSVEGGDGTATTTVLTQALAREAFAEVGEDSSKIREVRERLGQGLELVLSELSKMKREVGEEDIERIATISSLDPEVAKLIAEVVKEVGIHGVVTVEKGAKLGYSKEIVKGARIERGLISPFFVNDSKTGACILEDVYIVLADRKISSNDQIVPILNSIGTGKNIFIIADDVDSVALGTLAQNAQMGIAKIGAIKNPFSASAARDFLFDMAALTGGTVISEESGMKLSEATATLCGRADKVIITKDRTTIIGGRSDARLEDRINEINSLIENTISEYVKNQLGDRLAQLTGGIGVIRVGAYTDTEFNAKKYKFENAINATQAALQEGILPGGGVALALAAERVEDPIFRNALTAPIAQMARNAGMLKRRRLLFSVMEYVDLDIEENIGYDFKTKERVNMFDAGIIDPYKVVRLALESAVAIASSLISVETAIISENDAYQK